jgi:protein SDA1
METLEDHEEIDATFEPISIHETEMGLLKPASWK